MVNPFKAAELAKKAPPGNVENRGGKPPKKKRSIPGEIVRKPKQKTYGFYLEVAMVEELEAIAKEHDITISHLVKMILKEYLEGE